METATPTSSEVCQGSLACRWKLCEYWTWTFKGVGSRQGSVEGRRRTSVAVDGFVEFRSLVWSFSSCARSTTAVGLS